MEAVEIARQMFGPCQKTKRICNMRVMVILIVAGGNYGGTGNQS